MKMIMEFSYDFFVKFHGKKIGRNISKEVCYI